MPSGERRYHAPQRASAIRVGAYGSVWSRVTTITPAALVHTRQRWIDAGLLGLAAILVRIPALLAPTNLGYDDGGYGLAAIAMRQGFAPFRDIFSPQGPLFLPLVHVADLAGFQAIDAPRLIGLLAGAMVTIAVYFAAHELMDRPRALLAGALTAFSGVLLWTTAPLTGDGSAAAFATGSVAVALAYRRAPSTTKAIAITLLAGCALSIKSLLVGPALLIAWLLVINGKRWKHAVMVPIGAVATVALFSLPWGIGNVFNDYIAYHLDKTADRKPLANLDKLITTFASRDTVMVALALIGFGCALWQWNRTGRLRIAASGTCLDRCLNGTRVLWWWAGIVFVILVMQDPMFRNHLTALVAPLALLTARYRPSWRVVVVTVVIALPFQVMELRPLLVPGGYSQDDARVVEAISALPANAWVLSDEPGLVWRARRATDPFYVDASILRIHSNVEAIKITEDRLVESAGNPRVCAVVIGSKVRFGSFEGLPARLEEIGYSQSSASPTLYTRKSCSPPR